MRRNGVCRSRDRRWLQLEGLERRQLLAGNVQVSVAGSSLLITGDNLANNAAVIALPGGRFAVAGVGTTINGGAGPFVTTRSISNITANLNGGDDALGLTNNANAIFNHATTRLGVNLQTLLGVNAGTLQTLINANTTVTEFSLAGSLTVTGGAGDDVIGVIGSVGGSVVVSLGAADVGGGNAFGIDGGSLAAGNGVVGGVISIVGDGQNDVVAIVSTDVRSSVAVTLGGGANSLVVDDANIGGGLAVVGGSGSDIVNVVNSTIASIVNVVAGNGPNTITLNNASTDALTITGGSGVDTVTATRVAIRYGVSIATLDGNDPITIQDTLAGRSTIGGGLVIDSGSGDDVVLVVGTNVAHSLSISLQGGLDRLTMRNSNIGLNATIDGGADKDIVVVENTQVNFFVTVLLGTGDDDFTVRTSRAKGAYLYGGLGAGDRLTADAATRNAVDTFFAREFEVVV